MIHQIRAFLEYWKIKLPNVPIPQEWRDFVDSEWSGDKLTTELPNLMRKLQPFAGEFSKFIALQNSKSEKLYMINEFIYQDCGALFQLIQSIQTGDYQERNLAVKRIIPIFFAFDATNYKRWCVLGK